MFQYIIHYIYLCSIGEKHVSVCCLIFHQLQPVTKVLKLFLSYHLSWEQGTLVPGTSFL